MDGAWVGFCIRENRGYISMHDYKQNREALYRARFWKSMKNVERYFKTDSFRRLARHCETGLSVEQVEQVGTVRTVKSVVRTISLAEVQAAAKLASTPAVRRAWKALKEGT